MLRLIPVVVLLVLAAATAGQSDSANARRPTGETVPFIGGCVDFNEGDCGDLDGDKYWGALETRTGSDPTNTLSTPEHGLLDEQFPPHDTCDDDVDNDLDGRTDRHDHGCRVTCRDFTPGSICTDSDHDSWLKYMELTLSSNPKDSLSTPEVPGFWALEAVCSDGLDNDRDGLVDVADSGCNPTPPADCIDFDADTACEPL